MKQLSNVRTFLRWAHRVQEKSEFRNLWARWAESFSFKENAPVTSETLVCSLWMSCSTQSIGKALALVLVLHVHTERKIFHKCEKPFSRMRTHTTWTSDSAPSFEWTFSARGSDPSSLLVSSIATRKFQRKESKSLDMQIASLLIQWIHLSPLNPKCSSVWRLVAGVCGWECVEPRKMSQSRRVNTGARLEGWIEVTRLNRPCGQCGRRNYSETVRSDIRSDD